MSDLPLVPECRISRSASIEGELRRIGRAEIDFARAEIEAVSDPARAVHQCRKAIKRLRALVRLGGAEDAEARREIDHRLRDIGRLLAASRDADVIRRTAARLCDDNALSKPVEIAAARRRKPDRRIVQRVVDELSVLRAGLDAYFERGARTSDSLLGAIERTCHKSVRRLNRFRDRNRQALAHDWRKGVQRYANQLGVLAELCPERAAAELEPLDALAECLGEFNDLTILRAAIEDGQIGSSAQSRSALRKLARARQRVLRERALELGESIFRSPSLRSPSATAGLDKDPRRWL